MKKAIISAILVLGLVGNGAAYANARAYKWTHNEIDRIEHLLKNGPTDTDCREIEATLADIASERALLTNAEQRVLWKHHPWFAGVACYREIGHAWAGNDCAYQCGSLVECTADLVR